MAQFHRLKPRPSLKCCMSQLNFKSLAQTCLKIVLDFVGSGLNKDK